MDRKIILLFIFFKHFLILSILLFRVELQNYASGLWNQSSDYCGKGLFQVYNKPYIHQLVYSLLIGRVVVIHASPVNER